MSLDSDIREGDRVKVLRLWGAFTEVCGVVRRVTPQTITIEVTRLTEKGAEMRPGYTIEYRPEDGEIVK